MSRARCIDYKLKADVLKTGITKTIRKVDAQDYQFYAQGIVPNKELEDQYIDILFKYGSKYIKEARKINNASYRRVERLKERITTYLSFGTCIWVTLTFNDDILSNTSVDTRRKYVARFLKSVSNHYVANIDYGKNTEREHYHALVVVDRINDTWPYGFTWFEVVHKTTDPVKLAKYISKLTNHAIKESTKRCCYIYSRRT